MVNMTLIQADGTKMVIGVIPGVSLMEAARAASIEGLVAECGGAGACGTCHVYVEDGCPAAARLPAPSQAELDMLDVVLAPCINSRLSCQIIAHESLDGLTIRVPEIQY